MNTTPLGTLSDRNLPFRATTGPINWTEADLLIGRQIDNSKKTLGTEALRFDSDKTNWSLMPFEAVEEINKVLEFGAKKYAEWNFTVNGGMKHSRIINSCLRHIFAYMRGQDLDPESGLSHLAHAGCNILFLLYYKKHPEVFTKDDRNAR